MNIKQVKEQTHQMLCVCVCVCVMGGQRTKFRNGTEMRVEN